MTTITPTDPVCGMPVADTPQATRISYRDRTYLFCSGACRSRFEVEPDRYTGSEDTGTDDAARG